MYHKIAYIAYFVAFIKLRHWLGMIWLLWTDTFNMAYHVCDPVAIIHEAKRTYP